MKFSEINLNKNIQKSLKELNFEEATPVQEKAIPFLLENNQDLTHIQSLVVYPKYFRNGIGRKLVQFILDNYKAKIFTVETGINNHPAIKLYKNLGFQEQEQWDTNHGVRKVRFEKRI